MVSLFPVNALLGFLYYNFMVDIFLKFLKQLIKDKEKNALYSPIIGKVKN